MRWNNRKAIRISKMMEYIISFVQRIIVIGSHKENNFYVHQSAALEDLLETLRKAHKEYIEKVS